MSLANLNLTTCFSPKITTEILILVVSYNYLILIQYGGKRIIS